MDEGSLKGWAKVLVIGGVLYNGIAQFGDFVGGVREIVSVSREVASVVVNSAVQESTGSYRSLRSYRRGAGVPARLENLFRAVGRGDITPEEATSKAVRWLSQDGPLPATALAEINQAFKEIDRYEQLPLLSELLLPELEPGGGAPAPAPVPRRPRNPPANLIHVEVVRRSREDEIEIRTGR